MSRIKAIPNLVFAFMLAFAMLAAVIQPVSAAANAATCTEWHTVERGDYLVKIARLYDTDWRTLAELNDLSAPYTIYPGRKLCVSASGGGSGGATSGGATGSSTTASSGNVQVYADSVEEDTSVVLAGKNLQANTRYSVYLGKSSLLADATLVGTALTDKNGAFERSFRLPGKVVDVARVYVILKAGSDLASNWFINADLDGNTGGEGAPTMKLSIVNVKEDNNVKIKLTNMPANVTFVVSIGKADSKGLKGYTVGSMRDDDGGAMQATFEIPDEFEGRAELDIRVESKALGIVLYTTFDND